MSGFIGGLISTSIGISPATVFTLIFLKKGIDLDITVFSTAFLVFLSSSVSVIISILFGIYPSYLILVIFFGLSFISTYLFRSSHLFRQTSSWDGRRANRQDESLPWSYVWCFLYLWECWCFCHRKLIRKVRTIFNCFMIFVDCRIQTICDDEW